LGITTCAGNQTLHKTTTNALKVLHAAGLDHRRIPVVPGRHEPLMRPAVVAEAIHGASGLDGPIFPPLTTRPVDAKAADFIYNTAHQHLEKQHLLPDLPSSLTPPFTTDSSVFGHARGITLIAVGPLTNVAVLLLQHPNVRHLLRRIVLMGGAIGIGNVTPQAEFNLYSDPEAARIVFQSGIPLVMVPLEVTHTALVSSAVTAKLTGWNSGFGRLLLSLLLWWAESYRAVYGFPSPPLHDPCAVAWVINSSLFVSSERSVEVECGPVNGGRSVVDLYGVMKEKRKNVRVCTAMAVDGFWQLMMAALEQANAHSPLNKASID
jgi:purine nucleosidase